MNLFLTFPFIFWLDIPDRFSNLMNTNHNILLSRNSHQRFLSTKNTVLFQQRNKPFEFVIAFSNKRQKVTFIFDYVQASKHSKLFVTVLIARYLVRNCAKQTISVSSGFAEGEAERFK